MTLFYQGTRRIARREMYMSCLHCCAKASMPACHFCASARKSPRASCTSPSHLMPPCRYLSTTWDTDIGIWAILAWWPSSSCFFVCRHFHLQTDAGKCVPVYAINVITAAIQLRCRYGRSEQAFKDKACKDKCVTVCQVRRRRRCPRTFCVWPLHHCDAGAHPGHVHCALHHLLLSQRLLRGRHGQQVAAARPIARTHVTLSRDPHIERILQILLQWRRSWQCVVSVLPGTTVTTCAGTTSIVVGDTV
jgi:hypothetical protein